MNPRSGIIAGGNWIVDQIKLIDHWPEQDTLVGITGELRSNGGSPYNLLKDLVRLGAGFPLEAVGLLGDDEYGRWIQTDCTAHKIDIRQLQRHRDAATSYTDVLTVRSSGRRTFFHQRGANGHLAPTHFDFRETRAKHFHLGYLLLLDVLDAPGPDGKPAACEVLNSARQMGLLTSVDVVSDSAGRFAEVVLPTLPYVDFLFINDYEAARTTGAVLRDRSLDVTAVECAARTLLEHGVGRWVIIHFPEGAYACSRSGPGLWQKSLEVPASEIKGAAGAGDAFAAGVLYGVHDGWPMQRALLLGVSAAATSLSHPTCSDGVRPAAECLELARRFSIPRP